MSWIVPAFSPSRMRWYLRGTAIDSIVASGCIVSGSIVRRSLLFSNVRIEDRCTIEDSVLLPNVVVGRKSVLKKAVVDKHCRLTEGFTAGLDPDEDRRRFGVSGQDVVSDCGEVDGEGGLADPALLVGDGVHECHVCSPVCFPQVAGPCGTSDESAPVAVYRG